MKNDVDDDTSYMKRRFVHDGHGAGISSTRPEIKLKSRRPLDLEPISVVGERKRRVAHTSPTHTRLSTHNVQGQGDTPPTREYRATSRARVGPRHPARAPAPARSLLHLRRVVAAPLELRALLLLDGQDLARLGRHALPGRLQVPAELRQPRRLERRGVVRPFPGPVLGKVPLVPLRAWPPWCSQR